jgi:hypothetical protein
MSDLLIVVLSILVSVATAKNLLLPLQVDVTDFAASHASLLLAASLPELRGFVATRGFFSTCNFVIAELELDLDSSWLSVHMSPPAERYTALLSDNGTLKLKGSGLLGLAYGIHDLREYLALSIDLESGFDKCPKPGAWHRALASFAERGPPPPPQYALRTYSEEGELLALPDRGYYLPNGSGADTAAIAAEATALEAEVVPAILRLRMNTLTVLHSDVEDYVSYDLLSHFLPGAPTIYAQGDPHRARAAGIIGVIAPWIQV